MKILVSLLLCCQGAAAFVVPRHASTTVTPSSVQGWKQTTILFSSPPTDGDETVPPREITTSPPLTKSFQDAGSAMVDEQDELRMKSMGDFDSNPAISDESIDKVRKAIQARAKSLGVEKSTLSQQYIEERRQRALNERANKGSGAGPTLDLSQISTGDEKPRGSSNGNWDESLPTMMYDPADFLTQEQQVEADQVGQLPLWEQFMTEVNASKWPGFGSVIREIGVLAVIVTFSAVMIINWDSSLRQFYTGLGMLPTKEQVNKPLLDIDLPSGFTNNMNEEDLAKITAEMNQLSGGSKSSSRSSPSVNALLESANPDL